MSAGPEITCEFEENTSDCFDSLHVVSFDDGHTITYCDLHAEDGETAITNYAEQTGQEFEEEI